MKQYEYRAVEIEWIEPLTIRYKKQTQGQGAYSTPDINDLGIDGWELVQFMNHLIRPGTTQGTPVLVGIFKREIPKQSTD